MIISGIHDIIPDGETLSTSLGSGRVRIIKGFLNMCLSIPDWVGMVLEGGAAALLLYSLKDAMSCMKHSFEYLFINLIAFTAAAPIVSILSDYMEDEFAMTMLYISCVLGALICVFILGIKLSTVFHKQLKKLGIIFIICSILPFIVFVIGIIVGIATEEFPSFSIIIIYVTYWVYYYALRYFQI